MELTAYLQKKVSVELEDIAKESSQNKAEKENNLGLRGREQNRVLVTCGMISSGLTYM